MKGKYMFVELEELVKKTELFMPGIREKLPEQFGAGYEFYPSDMKRIETDKYKLVGCLMLRDYGDEHKSEVKRCIIVYYTSKGGSEIKSAKTSDVLVSSSSRYYGDYEMPYVKKGCPSLKLEPLELTDKDIILTTMVDAKGEPVLKYALELKR